MEARHCSDRHRAAGGRGVAEIARAARLEQLRIDCGDLDRATGLLRRVRG
jgi:hypothetical protein